MQPPTTQKEPPSVWAITFWVLTASLGLVTLCFFYMSYQINADDPADPLALRAAAYGGISGGATLLLLGGRWLATKMRGPVR